MKQQWKNFAKRIKLRKIRKSPFWKILINDECAYCSYDKEEVFNRFNSMAISGNKSYQIIKESTMVYEPRKRGK